MNNQVKRYRNQRIVDHGRMVSHDRVPFREEGLDLGGVWHALWHGKWLIVTACTLVLIATGVFLLVATPRFEATSIVSIQAQAAPLPGMETIEQGRSIDSELGRLRSSGELARRVVERLGEAAPLSEGMAAPVTGEGRDQQALAARVYELYQQVAFSATENNLIAITATSTSADEAALVANLYTQEYQKVSLEERRSRLRAARAFLESQVAQRQTDLQTLEQRWAVFMSTQSATSQGGAERLASEHAGLLAQRQTAQLQLQQERLQQEQIASELARLGPNLAGAITSDLGAEIEALHGRIASLRLKAEDYYTVNPSLRGRESEVPELDELVTSIRRLEERRESLAQQLADQTLTGAIADTRAGVDYATGLRQQAEASALRGRQLEMQLAGFDGRIDALEARLGGVPRQQVEVERIDRERKLTEEEYVSFVRQLQLIRVAEQAELGYVTVVREAYKPAVPVWPKPMQSLILSLLFGLFLGGGLALVRAAVRQRLREPGDLEEHGFRLVGVVPPIDKEAEALSPGGERVVVEGRSRSNKLLPLLSPWSPASENYRLIRTNIQHSLTGRSPRTILITSPEMSDGKTLTAVNLAVTMAQAGQRTLLIGADMRKPNAHKLLGIDRSPGLAEMLEGAVDEEAFSPERLATGIARLHFLAAGCSEIPPPELLGSKRMREVFDRLLAQYDTVIVDAPPVLAATDALLLAQLCEATIVVVTAERTSPSTLEAVRGMLEGVGVEVAGTVLNRFAGRADGAGHYGYGYKYAYAENE